MMKVRCYLGPSVIEGLGVYTSEPIARGTIIWRFEPDFDQVFRADFPVSQPDHIREFLERYTYVHPWDASLIVLDADEGRFMNHSESPNTDFSDGEVGIALRDIAAGEELTCDYAQFTIGDVVHQPPRHHVHAGADMFAADSEIRIRH